MTSYHGASTLIRRHFDVVCLLVMYGNGFVSLIARLLSVTIHQKWYQLLVPAKRKLDLNGNIFVDVGMKTSDTSFDTTPTNKHKKDCLWKQITHYGLENEIRKWESRFY